MPTAVLYHARHTLAALEERAGEDRRQVDLFAAPQAPEPHAEVSLLQQKLVALELDTLSPREALDLLYALQGLAQKP
jgi:DNA mismatch repair protein MutS